MKQALLLIDIQNDYFTGGAMELVGSEQAAIEAAKLLRHFREKGLPVIHIQHVSTRAGATFFLPDSRGAEIHDSVAPVAGEPVFQKTFPNSFRDTGLLEHLRGEGVTQLVVAGSMTHMCIDTTVRAAADLGFTCLVAHDACATKALSFGPSMVPADQVQAAFMAGLNGLFATVLSADDICRG
jgi:nicotinamidase-related amidase